MPLVNNAPNPAGLAAWQAMEGTDKSRISLTAANLPQTHNLVSNFFSSLGDTYRTENQAAFNNLLTSIHAAHPNRSALVQNLLQADFDAGNPLTSRMVEKAIHLAANSAARLCDRWDTVAKTDILSPRTARGAQVTQEFSQQVQTRYAAVNAQTLTEKLVVVRAMRDEIRDAPTVGPLVKEKLLSLADLHIGRMVFAQKVAASGNLDLAAIQNPERDGWKLLMDGNMQANGVAHFENERGYMAGMLRGMNRMIDTLGQPLTADMYRDLHDAAVGGVHERDEVGPGTTLRLGYRDCGVQFGLVGGAGGNMTNAGLQEFAASPKHNGGWIEFHQDGADLNLVAVEKTPQQCRAKAAQIIARYEVEVAAARLQPVAGGVRETAILTAIAKCCQDLDQHHLFSDGNIRTVAFLTMNKLLLDNGLSPTIFNDPNDIDMHSVAEIVALMRQGQTTFQAL